MRNPFCHASFLQSARERPELEMTLLSEVPVGFIYRPLQRSLPSFPQPHYHSMNFLLPLVLELDSIDICIESSPLCPTVITPTPTHLNTVNLQPLRLTGGWDLTCLPHPHDTTDSLPWLQSLVLTHVHNSVCYCQCRHACIHGLLSAKSSESVLCMRASVCTSLKEGQRLLENQVSMERNFSLSALFTCGSSYQFPKLFSSSYQRETSEGFLK